MFFPNLPLAALATSQIELLADSWRWWAAMGALLALYPVSRWFTDSFRQGGEDEPFKPHRRKAIAIALIFGLLANIAAGGIIPFATDNRLSWLTMQAPAIRLVLAFAWLSWGSLSWSVAIGFADRPRRMALSAVFWWLAVYVAAGATIGAQL